MKSKVIIHKSLDKSFVKLNITIVSINLSIQIKYAVTYFQLLAVSSFSSIIHQEKSVQWKKREFSQEPVFYLFKCQHVENAFILQLKIYLNTSNIFLPSFTSIYFLHFLKKNRRKMLQIEIRVPEQEKQVRCYITVVNQGSVLNEKKQEKDVKYNITVGTQGSTLNGKNNKRKM